MLFILDKALLSGINPGNEEHDLNISPLPYEKRKENVSMLGLNWFMFMVLQLVVLNGNTASTE